MPKNCQFGSKSEACGQTVLPDRSIVKGQILVKNIQMRHFG